MLDSRQLTPNFHISELMCRDGTTVPFGFLENARRICLHAQLLRNRVGPLVVVSGFRTPEWNKRVGGAAKSQHLTSSALDLRSATLPADELHRIYLWMIRTHQVDDGGLGLYKSWLHIDLGRPRRWSGK